MADDYLSDPSSRRRGSALVDDFDAAQEMGRARAYVSQGFLPPRRDALSSGADYFATPWAPRTRTAAAPAAPLANPAYRNVHAQREVLRQTEELYHQQLEDFDKGEGAALRPEKDAETGREIKPGPAQADLQSMIDKSQGDQTTAMVPREIRVAEKNLRLLKEKRERIAAEANRVSQARQTFDQQVFLPARNAMMGGDVPMSDMPPPAATGAPAMDFMQRGGEPGMTFPQGTVIRSGAPPNPKDGGGEPTPPPPAAPAKAPVQDPQPDTALDSLQRIKSRRDNYQAMLDQGGDNLRQDVRDRLKGQVSLLNSKAQGLAMEQADEINRQIVGHISGQAETGKPVDPAVAAKYFDQFKTLSQAFAEHAGPVQAAADRPQQTIPHLPSSKSDESTMIGMVKGAIDGLSDSLSGLTSNTNTSIMMSLGTLSKAQALGDPLATAAMTGAKASFIEQMSKGAVDAYKRVRADLKDPNVTKRQTTADIVSGLANAVFTAATAHSLIHDYGIHPGKPAVPGEPATAKPRPDQAPPTTGAPTPPPAPRPPTSDVGVSEVPVDEGLAGRISTLRAAATKAETPAPAVPASPVVLDHRVAGFESPEEFQKSYTEKAQHDVFETADEYLRRIYCAKLGRGNFSIA